MCIGNQRKKKATVDKRPSKGKAAYNNYLKQNLGVELLASFFCCVKVVAFNSLLVLFIGSLIFMILFGRF